MAPIKLVIKDGWYQTLLKQVIICYLLHINRCLSLYSLLCVSSSLIITRSPSTFTSRFVYSYPIENAHADT